MIVGEIDKADIGPARGTFIGIVATGDGGAASAMGPSPDLAVREGAALDKALALGPAVELVQRCDRAVP